MSEENVAVEPQVPGLESLSEQERHDWRMTGELPKAEPAKESAQSDEKDGKDTSQAAESATDKGTEASKGEEKRTSRPPGRLSYQELREQLRARTEELEKLKAPKQEAAPPKEEAKTEKREKLRARPTPYDAEGKPKAEYKTWQDYEDDLLAWNRESTIHEIEERTSKARREETVAQQNKVAEDYWNERAVKARELNPDFDEVVTAKDSPARQITPGSTVDQWIMGSENGLRLLYHFSKNPADLEQFKNVSGKTPQQVHFNAMNLLRDLENRLFGGSAAKSDTPPPKVTKAPPPVSEVGGRASAPADETVAAVNNGDFAAYARRANQRETQHLRK